MFVPVFVGQMGVFVSALVRNCLHCQKAKVHRHVSLQAAHIPVPVPRFSHLHVDLVGPLPRSSGFSYLFTVIDRTTRWPEALPLASTTAADCSGPPSGVDPEVRGTGYHHKRQGSTVHIFIMGEPLFSSLHLTHSNHRLPPSIQQPRGEVPPPSEGCSPCQGGRSRLVFAPALGIAGV